MPTNMTEKTFYGSGSIYEFIYDKTTVTIPTTLAGIKAFVETYATPANQVGYLKGGFQVEFSTETLEDQSDLGEMKVSLITAENGTITYALFNANGETLEKIYPTAKTTNGVTVVGGLKGTSQAEHVIIFVAADETGGQTIVIAVGKNTSGFTLNWNPDSVEPLSCNFSMVPYNTDGNLMVCADVDLSSGTHTYPITYVMNGGEWAASYTAPNSYSPTGSDVTLPTSSNITKDGYTFGGWFEETDLGTAVTTIDVSETEGAKNYIAKWTT